MKKFLALCLMVVTMVALCSCGVTTLNGSYTANDAITFEFHEDGTFYVETESLIQEGSYENTDDCQFDLMFLDNKIGTVNYSKDNDVCLIKIGDSTELEYAKTEDAGLKAKFEKANKKSDKK